MQQMKSVAMQLSDYWLTDHRASNSQPLLKFTLHGNRGEADANGTTTFTC